MSRLAAAAAAEYKAWLLLPWLGRITPCCDLPRKRAECVDADDVVVLGKYLWAFKARAVEDKDSSAIASIRIGRLFIGLSFYAPSYSCMRRSVLPRWVASRALFCSYGISILDLVSSWFAAGGHWRGVSLLECFLHLPTPKRAMLLLMQCGNVLIFKNASCPIHTSLVSFFFLFLANHNWILKKAVSFRHYLRLHHLVRTFWTDRDLLDALYWLLLPP